MNELRERWSDPLLTTLTMLVLLFMFVVAPLQAVGIIKFQEFAFVFTLVLVGGVFILLGPYFVGNSNENADPQ